MVALPIGLSLSSSIISNNTVTTDQPIGDAPFDLPDGKDYKTEYKDGKWEILNDDGPFSSGTGEFGTGSEVAITFTNAGTVRFYIIVEGEDIGNRAMVNSRLGEIWSGPCISGEGYLNDDNTIGNGPLDYTNAITIVVSNNETGNPPCYSQIDFFCHSFTPVRIMIEFTPSDIL